MLSSFKSKIGNVYYPVYILELLTGVSWVIIITVQQKLDDLGFNTIPF